MASMHADDTQLSSLSPALSAPAAELLTLLRQLAATLWAVMPSASSRADALVPAGTLVAEIQRRQASIASLAYHDVDGLTVSFAADGTATQTSATFSLHDAIGPQGNPARAICPLADAALALPLYANEAYVGCWVATLQTAPLPPDVPRAIAVAQEACARLQAGDLQYRVQLGADSIFQPAADAYNAMMDSLQAQHATVQALRESEERYRGLIESQHDLILRTTLDGHYTFVNDAYCHFFGKTQEELLGHSFMPLVHEEDLPATLAAMQGLFAPPYRIRVEQRALTPSGWRWLSWEDSLIRDAEGHPVEIQAIGRDMTPQREAEQALRETHDMLQAVIHASPVAIVGLDAEGRILLWNASAEALYGWRAEEVLGQWPPFIPADQLARFRCEHARVLADGKFYEAEVCNMRRDGSLIDISLSASVITDGPDEGVRVVCLLKDITERKRAEAALRESEATKTALLHAIPDLLVRIRDDGTILDWKAGTDSLGQLVLPAVWHGRRMHELLPTTDVSELQAALGRALSQGTMQLQEFSLRVGEEWRSFEIRFAACAADEVLALVRDITDRERAEEALRQSEATKHAILQTIPDLMFRLDATGRFLDCHAPSSFALYVPPEAFLGKTIDEVMPPAVAALSHASMTAALQTGEIQVFTYPLPIQGKDRHFEAHYLACGENEVLVIVRDVTARLEAEDALRESETKFRTLVERLPVITYIATADNLLVIHYISPQVEAILGYTPEEWIADAHFFLQHVHEEDRARVQAIAAQVSQTGAPFTMEYRLYDRAGKVHWFHDDAVAVCDDDGRPQFYQGVLVDITEHKLAQEQEQLITQMREADRLKSEFLSLVSHELRTPLTPIRGVVDLLCGGHLGPLTEDQTKALEIAQRQAIRLQMLINDLLDFSCIESGHLALKPEPVAVHDLVRESCTTFEKFFREQGLYLHAECPAEMPLAWADRHRVTQIIDNLLANAAKFTEQGGVTVRARMRDGMVALEVADTGIGMEPTHAERIFEPFFQIEPQLTRRHGGSGLGLAIVRQLVQALHGKIWAESHGPGQGSTFIVTLPTLQDTQ